MNQKIDSFQENGVTYYKLYLSCPVCLERGVSTKASFWSHYDNSCNGLIYVGENAYYKCTKCGRSAHVLDWKYSCPTHSTNSSDQFIGVGAEILAKAIAVAGQLVEAAGIAWLQIFLANLEDGQKKRGYGVR